MSRRSDRRRFVLAAAWGMLITMPALEAAAAVDNGPAAPSRPAVDTYFGTRLVDPWRNLENPADPAVAAWMRAQARRAAATLASIPGRDRLVETFRRQDAAVAARVTQVTRVSDDTWVFLRRGPRDNQFKLVIRRGAHDRVLVDPDALARRAGGRPHAVNWYAVSPDGARVAYGLSRDGSEDAVLHVVDTRSGREIGPPLPRAEYGGVSWAPDGRSFVFTELRRPARGDAPSRRYLDSQVRLVRVDDRLRPGALVFGNAVKGLPIGPVEAPSVSFSADGRWALGYAVKGTQNDLEGLYVAPQDGVRAGRPAWRRVLGPEARVTSAVLHGDTLALLGHRTSPRYEVRSLDLAETGAAEDLAADRARTWVAGGERVITGIAAAADALYLAERDGNVKRLYKRAWGGDAPVEEVALPIAGSFQLAGDEGGPSAADPRRPGLVIELEGWTRARRIVAVEADGRVRDTGLQPAGPDDAPDDIEATEVLVTADDGARVPMSILHRRGLPLDGARPTLLSGYASYGLTEEPDFSAARLAWLRLGGVYAVANPRGSGAWGDDWYKAGLQEHKPRSWRDFIACAEYLVAHGYTRPQRLGIVGGSAGGLLVGRAMTERPDLFGAVVASVGLLDAVRSEDEPNGAPNVPEFGTRTTEDGFRSLLAMSTYHHVRPGTDYPAVMLTAGVHDPRVAVWQSTKMAARLMAEGAGRRPVLLRLDYASGHGIGDTREQVLLDVADTYAFLLWSFGIEGFQPAPRPDAILPEGGPARIRDRR